MRLWTLHPKYLDAQGLVALWREALLAQAVLQGRTVGYRHHPQLLRFQSQPDPVAAIASYLGSVHEEALARGYRFDASKIAPGAQGAGRIAETRGQLAYEWEHLRAKLRRRDADWLRQWKGVARPAQHPLFRLVAGPVRAWEKVAADSASPRKRKL